jgi:hypothetical protein
MLRLLVLWTAWTIDAVGTREARTQIAACKYTCAEVQHDIVYRAVHVFGSLGVTRLTPLHEMWNRVPWQSIMDGPDEVHMATVARRVLREHEPHGGVWPTDFLPHQRAEAKAKYAHVLDADAELAAQVEWIEQQAYVSL